MISISQACEMQLTPQKAETRMDKGLAGDSEKEALYVHIRPPLGAELKGVAASRLASPRVPPPPRAAPGVGHAAPGPLLGCAPCALSRTGPGYLLTNEKGRCGLSTPEGGGQHSRASIGRDPRFHGYFLKKAPQAGATGVCETLCVLHTEGVSFERG